MTALSGKVCIVTGGGSGIGRAVVLEMADMGAKVAVAGRTAAKLDAVVAEASSAPGEARAYAMDVADYVAVNSQRSPTCSSAGVGSTFSSIMRELTSPTVAPSTRHTRRSSS